MSKLKTYGWNVLISIDQLFNAVLGGDPDETLSSRMGKRTREDCSVCYWICRGLHLIDPNHCADAVERDRGKRNVIK